MYELNLINFTIIANKIEHKLIKQAEWPLGFFVFDLLDTMTFDKQRMNAI